MSTSALEDANRLLDKGDLFSAGEILMGHLARFSPGGTIPGWEEVCEQVAAKNRSMRLAFKALRDEVCAAYRTTDIEKAESVVLEQIRNRAIDGRFVGLENKRIELAMSTSQTMKRWMELQDQTLLPTFRKTMHYSDEVIALIERSLKPEELHIAGWMINQFYPGHMSGKYDGISINHRYGEAYHLLLTHLIEYRSPYDIPYSYTEVENGDEEWEVDQNYSGVFGDAEEDSVDEEGIDEYDLNYDEDEVLPRLIASYERIGARGHIRLTKPIKLSGAYESLQKYVIEMEHFKAFSKVRRLTHLTFRDAKVRLAIRQYHGDEALSTLDRFLHCFSRSGTIESQQSQDACMFFK